jgi:hypothetical protein
MMLTIEELEVACNNSQPVEFLRHIIEAPELSLQAMFYPFGFPAEVKTNSHRVLEQFEKIWGKFEKQHETEPIRCEVHLIESGVTECPPEPTYRLMLPLMMFVADADNYTIIDLERGRAKITISDASLRHPLYLQYFLLGPSVCCIATQCATPVHAACVALNGRGVLLCGDSGAGKSTLSYACARAGWTYVTDDASYLLNGGTKRLVTGNCHQVRFRPSAAELFQEIADLEITPRAAGKPSIELPTAPMVIACAQTVRVDFIVFLNRRAGTEQLVPYRRDVARHFMRQVLYGPPDSLALQYEAIERLLTAGVFELQYTGVDWAIDRLRALVQEGR